MTVDGSIAFTGGMNIRGCCVNSAGSEATVSDLHFRPEGPIVRHAQEVFIADWNFATGDLLNGDGWLPELPHAGSCLARGIPEGPDDHVDQLRLTLLGACQVAERSIRIISPYFLPDSSLISALNVASLRGVLVEILIPEQSNERLVQWACDAQLWQLVDRGCQVRKTHHPFDHSKLVIVDDEWVLMGSANWDPRSLRLNFEFNVECYNRDLAEELNQVFESKKQRSTLVTSDLLRARRLIVKLRDGVARLASPFL